MINSSASSIRRARWLRSLALFGPSFVAAVAYLDPGNFATNITAGAQFGYLLVWVVLAANLMAMFIQYLAARIGIVTGKTLPELIGEHVRTPYRIAYWIQAQLVAIATDLAEVVGGAVALNVLLGWPILVGAVVTVVISTLILGVQTRHHQRAFEWVIMLLVLIIAGAIGRNVWLSHPTVSGFTSGLVPRFAGNESLILAAGMLGATVMPHAIYIHSALVRDRFGQVGESNRQKMLTVTKADIVISMALAGAVNCAMVVLAAAALQGKEGTDTLSGAHEAIASVLGPGAGLAFAIALFVSGLASTTVGSYSGSVVMNGLLKIRISPFFSRLITAVPAIVILALGAEPTWVLVISQVLLSFGIPFVLLPLISLSKNPHVSKTRLPWWIIAIAYVCAGVVIALNLALLQSVIFGS